MRWCVVIGGSLLLAGAWLYSKSGAPEAVFQPVSRPVEGAPVCPWRNPDSDLQRFFPGATGWRTEIRILSDRRLELAQRLGRPAGSDENLINLYRVFEGDRTLGTVLTRRVKGEHGVIEVVLAVDRQGAVAGIRLQRLREPEAVAQAIENPSWLAAFSGKNAESDWRLGNGIPDLPTEARPTGAALVAGVRSLLILFHAAEERSVSHIHA